MTRTRISTIALALLAFATPLRADDGEAKETPAEAFATLQKAVKGKDFDAIWNFMSLGTRKVLVEQVTPELDGYKQDVALMEALSKATGKSVEEIRKMEPEEFLKISIMSERMEDPEGIDATKFLGAEVQGKEAICRTWNTRQGEDAQVDTYVMVLEEGRWRMDFAATERVRSAPMPQAAFDAYKMAARAKDSEAAWSFFSKKSQDRLIREMSPAIADIRKDAESMKAIAVNSGKSLETLNAMEAAEFVKTWVTSKEMQVPSALERLEWIGAKVEETSAVCTIRNRMFDEKGVEELRAMILEDGTWKFDVEATDKLYENK